MERLGFRYKSIGWGQAIVDVGRPIKRRTASRNPIRSTQTECLWKGSFSTSVDTNAILP